MGLSDLHERLGEINSSVESERLRVDRFENELKSDIRDIKKDLKDIMAWINRTKGFNAGVALLSGLCGSVITAICSHYIGH